MLGDVADSKSPEGRDLLFEQALRLVERPSDGR